jgi:hypothetical protein
MGRSSNDDAEVLGLASMSALAGNEMVRIGNINCSQESSGLRNKKGGGNKGRRAGRKGSTLPRKG